MTQPISNGFVLLNDLLLCVGPCKNIACVCAHNFLPLPQIVGVRPTLSETRALLKSHLHSPSFAQFFSYQSLLSTIVMLVLPMPSSYSQYTQFGVCNTPTHFPDSEHHGNSKNTSTIQFSKTQLLLHTFAHLTGPFFRVKAKLLPSKIILGLV